MWQYGVVDLLCVEYVGVVECGELFGCECFGWFVGYVVGVVYDYVEVVLDGEYCFDCCVY